MCDNNAMCNVAVNNGVFGDPCGGVYKYLRVTYQCVGATGDVSGAVFGKSGADP